MSKTYEAMFIVDSAKAKEDYAKMEGECLGAITRHSGRIVKSVKWDERRLAYEIKKVKRGTFILVHFDAQSDAVARIERQCLLNESILRVLILADEDGVETQTGGLRERAESEASVVAADVN